MIKVKFNNSNDYISCNFSKSAHVVTLTGVTEANTTGFKTYRASDLRYLGDWSAFKTVYRMLDGAIQLSDDGSVYVEPTKTVTVNAIFNEVEAQEIEVKVMVNGEEMETVALNKDNGFAKVYENVPVADAYSITCDVEIEDAIVSVEGTTVMVSPIPVPEPYEPTVEEQLSDLMDMVIEIDERLFALEEAE